MSETVSARLPPGLAKDVAELAKLTQAKRSDLLRDVLARGIAARRLEHAVDAYRTGAASLGKAAQLAGTSIGAVLDELKRASIPLNYGMDQLADDMAWARE